MSYRNQDDTEFPESAARVSLHGAYHVVTEHWKHKMANIKRATERIKKPW